MGHNSWRAKADRIEFIQRGDTNRELEADAVVVVEKWNADLELRRQDKYGFHERRHYPQFSPHIGTAIRAGKPFLRLYCPACQQFGDLDLRNVVRPPDTPIGAIYDFLVCTFGGCRGRGDNPPPVPIGLFATPDHALSEVRERALNKLKRG
jgi:hypothetical protein